MNGSTADTADVRGDARTGRERDALVVCDRLVRILTADGVEVQALQGLDLRVASGELTALVGVSGSGKSTLLNILAGLDAPSAGAAEVAGYDLVAMDAAARLRYRREVVGFVWQQAARNLLPYLTAARNVALPMQLAGDRVPRRRRAGRVRELLDLLGVGHCHDRLPERMSGGEQQRVAIAVALANSPALLLADEPTGELDSRSADEILTAMRTVNEELGTTVLIVTHDASVASAVRRTVAIRDGRTSSEVLRRAALDERERTGREPMVAVRDLARTHGGGPAAVHALRGVDLEVFRGELVAVRGPSGAGKTTLLNLVGGLDRPDGGQVVVDGVDLSAAGEKRLSTLRRERIGFVFQTFGLVPVLTAAENVGVPMRLLGTPWREREERVAHLLALVGLEEHAAQRPGELSGGQQQRVAIARAPANRPALLIADEPTSQLDAQTRRAVTDLLRAAVDDEGAAALVTTHDDDLLERADRVLELRDGVLTGARGTVEDARERDVAEG